MIPGYDGLYASTDYPASMPELPAAPPKKGFHWTPPADALSREQYLAIGRPILKAAGFLQDEAVADKPPLPKMPDSKRVRKPRVVKPVMPPVAKPVADEERVPF